MTGTSVDRLREPPGPADVDVTLVARGGRVTLPSGRVIDGFTLNGTTPGPEIRAAQGQMVQVRLVNENVAGVTQDAVRPGGSFVYRFRAGQVARSGTTPTKWPTRRCRAGCSAPSSSRRATASAAPATSRR